MTRISNSDRIALALQARLQRLRKKEGDVVETSADKPELRQSSSLVQLQNLLNEDASDDAAVTRQIVSHLLGEEFGQDVVDDPRFATVVNRVSALLLSDHEGQMLIKEAVLSLRTETGPSP